MVFALRAMLSDSMNRDNYGYDGATPEVEAFFAALAPTLETFAARHRLQIERYVRGNPSWDFLFRDFEDGIGLIQVVHVGADTVLVAGSREIRDLAAFRRSTGRWVRGQFARDDPQIPMQLTFLLKEILALPADKLIPDGRDYTALWKGSVRELRAYLDTLPVAVLE